MGNQLNDKHLSLRTHKRQFAWRILIPFLVSQPDITGLLQRVLVGFILLWWEVLAIKMYLLNRKRDSITVL